MAKVPYKASPSVDASMTGLPAQNMPHVDLSGPGEAMAQLGKAFQGLGATIDNNIVKMQDRQNDAIVSDLSVRAQTDLGLQEKTYTSLEGSKAIEGYKPYVDQVEETRKKWYGEADATGNPEIARRFRMQFDGHVGSAIVRAAGHNAQQMKVYETNTAIARENNAVDDTMANYKDPYAFERNMGTVRETVNARAKTNGWSEEQTQAEMRRATDRVYDARIRGYAKTDPITARKILDENRKVIGGKTQIELDTHLNQQDASVRARLDAERAIKSGEFEDEEPVVVQPEAPGPRTEADPVDPQSPAEAVATDKGIDDGKNGRDASKTDDRSELEPGATEVVGERIQYAEAPTGTKSDAPPAAPKVASIGPLQDQGPRPSKYSGEITLGESKFSFVSGGGKTPSAPYGTYPITPGKEGPIIQRLGGVTLNNNTIYDPLLKRNRGGIALHPASGADASAGCFIIPDGQWPKFKAELMQKMRTEGPQYLTVNPDGSAFISAKPGRLLNDPVGSPGPSSGLNQKRINEILQSPRIGSVVSDVAMKAGYDPNKLATFISIESSGNPNNRTGSYHGLGQLSKEEFAKYGPPGGNIYDPRQNLEATVKKLQAEDARFAKQFGREPTALETYMMHQQGEAGARAHLAKPEGIAWQNVRKYYTDEAARKRGYASGDDYAKAAIWNNIPSADKKRLGSVDNVKSADITMIYRDKIFEGQYGNQQDAIASTWDPSEGDAAQRTGVLPKEPGPLQAPFSNTGNQRISEGSYYAQLTGQTATDAPIATRPPQKEKVSPGPLREDSGPEWLEQMLDQADAHSDKIAPGNIQYKQNLRRNIITEYNNSQRIKTAKERINYGNLMGTVMGDYNENMVRSMDQIYGNEAANAAYKALPPAKQKAIQQQVENNSKKDLPETPERFNRYRELKGMAVNEPEKFLDETIADLPRTRMNELLNLQLNLKKHAQVNSYTQQALRDVGKMAAEAGVVAQYNDPGKMRVYNEFAGGMQVKIQEYVEQNKKRPPLDEVQRMAADLLTQKQPFSWESPSTWFGSEMKFELPSKWTYQGKERSQDELRKIFKDAYGVEPTPADMYRFWQRSVGTSPNANQ